MEGVVKFFSYVAANWDGILGAVTALISAVIGISLLIPGEQPEKFLQSIVDFLAKFSKKPKQ